MNLGTPLVGTRTEIEELVEELDVKLTDVESDIAYSEYKYTVKVSDKFDTTKFNGIERDVCLMYILDADAEPDETGVLMYIEYQESRSYIDIAMLLAYFLYHSVDLSCMHKICEATED